MEASYYEKQQSGKIRCNICPHRCVIIPGKRGRCRTRYNNNGMLSAVNYGQCTSIALDPIEKKPLLYFHPGSFILSLGSWGCNLSCSFCQNWQISQENPTYEEITPQQAVQLSVRLKRRGNIGIAYTYNEPTVWYEFIRQTAPLVHDAGLCNIMVTNGFIEEAPLREILPFIDAWNIDLKSFRDDFYRDICGASIKPVLRTIQLAAAGSHVEVTNLVVPGENDDPQETEEMARWISSINPDIPLHVTRYFPRYHMTAPPTPIATLYGCARAAKRWLHFVHIGNVSKSELNNYT